MRNEADLYGPDYFIGNQYGKDKKRQKMYTIERRRIESFIDGGNILDVGCGIGDFLQGFDDRKWFKHGFDISDYAVHEAIKRGIAASNFLKDYRENSFDVIVFRGTLQHLHKPFETIRKCYRYLKPGGLMSFLSTPNTNSPYFYRYKTLPALDPQRNWLLPSDLMMKRVLYNLGFAPVVIFYPYLKTPYAKPIRDFIRYITRSRKPYAFFRSMMEIHARKPAHG